LIANLSLEHYSVLTLNLETDTIMASLLHLVYFLLIGLAAGWLAGQFTKGKSFGLVNDLIVGVIGALLGGFLFSLLGLSATSLIGSLITATVGAVAFLYILRAIKNRS
jgi:uncharacterized membrane protein YeaQ/YmgE (transglycosylase-associated protein family)